MLRRRAEGGPFISWGALVSLARQPELWPTAARLARSVVAPGWWRRWPLLPLPPAQYIRMRQETMFGSTQGPGSTPERLSGPELVAYLEWCRRMNGLAR
jgi:hypothetical protein